MVFNSILSLNMSLIDKNFHFYKASVRTEAFILNRIIKNKFHSLVSGTLHIRPFISFITYVLLGPDIIRHIHVVMETLPQQLCSLLWLRQQKGK